MNLKSVTGIPNTVGIYIHYSHVRYLDVPVVSSLLGSSQDAEVFELTGEALI